MYPASFVSTVSVSACKLSGDDILFDESYSYFNDMVDAAAPGTDITGLSIDGGVITGKGSSFSAPHVSALAVLLKQHWPDADVEDFRAALEASCIDLGEEGKDNYYGFGFIDTEAFVKYIAETAPVPPMDEPEVPPETPDEAPVRELRRCS